jgi:hypothetical protein
MYQTWPRLYPAADVDGDHRWTWLSVRTSCGGGARVEGNE